MEFYCTHISKRSVELATKVLESEWVSEGDVVVKFEAALAARLNVRHPIAVNSGTSALHLALAVSKIGPGDEVIIPPQTFVATGLVVLMQHAVPVFADIDPMTGNISSQSIAEKITPRTKAIIPVHWGGYPCDMDEINALARRHNLIVIEDAAHALGATYKGKPIGAVSRFTAFSFQAIKHLTTGDGGMLCCLDEEDAHIARRLRWFGIDRRLDKPDILGERVYDLKSVGYKYHMNDLASAVGLGNLADFPARLQRRQQIGAYYRSELQGVAGVRLLRVDNDRTHAYWLFTMLVEQREAFIRKLASHGIPASVVHLRIDRNSVFGGIREDLPGQFDTPHPSVLSFAMSQDKELIGCYGFHLFSFGRAGHRAALALDIMVTPQFQGKGVFRALANFAMQQTQAHNPVVYYVMANSRADGAHVHGLGWHRVNVFTDYVCRTGLASPLLPKEMEFIPCGSFTPEVANFLTRLDELRTTHNLFSISRSPQFLQWRFLRNPRYSYRFFLCKLRGSLYGYVVLKEFCDPLTNNSFGDIVDLYWAEDDLEALADMLRFALHYFHRQGIQQATMWLQTNRVLDRVGRDLGFKPTERQRYLCCKIVDDEYRWLEDRQRWFLTMADSEVY